MSDTVNAGIMRPMGVDYLGDLQKWQAYQQAQAQTALTQRQVQGAGIGNQLQNLNLQRTGYLYGLAGVPGVGPNASGATSAPQSGFLPGGGAGTAPVSPVAATPLTGAPQAPVAGGAAGAAGPAGAGGASSPGGQPWPGQASYERYGIPLDPLTYAQVATSQDPTKAKAEAVESRRQILFSMANVPTDQFPQVAQAAFNAGLITPQMLQNSIANPSDTQSRVLQAFKDPESHASAVKALVDAGVQIDPNTNQATVSPIAIQAAQAKAQAGAAGKSAGDLPLAGALAAARAQGSATADITPITQQAVGPDGKPAFDANGAPILTTTLANKAVAAARAAGTPGGAPPAGNGIAGNPLLGPIPGGGQPPLLGPNGAVPAPAAAGPVPGIPTGAVVQTPAQAANLEVQKAAQQAQNANDISAMGSHRTELANQAQSAVASNSLLDQMRVEGQGFDHGNFTNAYQGIAKDVGSIQQAFGGKMPASVGDWEAFQKNAGALARTAASALSPRVGVQELELVQKYLPSANMSSQAFSRIADQSQGLNDYQIARNAAAANFTGRPAQFESQFNANVTPGVFILHRMSVPDAATFAHSLQATPEGRQTWSRIMSGAQYAQQHGLFDAVGGGD